MNKRTGMLIIIILLAITGIVYLIVSRGAENKRDKAKTTSIGESNSRVVAYDGKVFTPNTVVAKKGDTIRVTNFSSKKVMVAITGKQAAPVLTIEPNATTQSPAMQEDGTYSFKDMTEALINLPVRKTTTTTSEPVQPVKIEHTNETVDITNSGFEPATVNAKIGVVVKLMNTTSAKKTILAGQTKFDLNSNSSTSLNFDSPGSFTYINEANKTQVLRITVE